MSQFRRVRPLCQLLLFLPFLLVALTPQGMMLSQSSSNKLGNILILCSVDGMYSVPINELIPDLPKIPDADTTPIEHEETHQESSCPYSIANSSLLANSISLAVINIALVQPKRFAVYQRQYTLKLHPASYPRGPPLPV